MRFPKHGGRPDSGPGPALKEAERYIADAEGYLKHSSKNPPNIQLASGSYRSALAVLAIAKPNVGPKDGERYQKTVKRAEEMARRIIEGTDSSIAYHLVQARRGMETGDSIRASDEAIKAMQEELRTSEEHPTVSKYMEQWRAAHPEAVEQERQREEQIAEFMERHRPIASKGYTNLGYISADSELLQAEQDVEAAEETAKAAGLGPDFGALSATIRDVRKELEDKTKGSQP